MKAALLLFSLCQVLPLVIVAVDVVDCFDNDEALELSLLQRRSSTGSAEALSERPKKDGESHVVTGRHHGSVATWLLERIGRVADAAKLDSTDAVWLYGLWPSLLALGLPALASGGGLVQVLAFAVFWLLLRPCATMLQVMTGPPMPDESLLPRHVGFTPEAMTLAAHFYWTWGLFELVVRRRSLLQRLLAVSTLAALCVPVPLAQIYLGALNLHSAAAGALLGDVLGVAFFFSLRSTTSWHLIEALQYEKASSRWLHDNLTTAWGGCRWPALPSPVRCCKALEALTNPTPLVHDFSEDEDFTVLRRMAIPEVPSTSPNGDAKEQQAELRS